MESPVGLREVVPNQQTLPERCKEFTINTGILSSTKINIFHDVIIEIFMRYFILLQAALKAHFKMSSYLIAQEDSHILIRQGLKQETESFYGARRMMF